MKVVCSIPVLLFALLGSVTALTQDEREDASDDMRYELLKMKGVFYRFDRKTGILEKFTETADGKLALEQVPVMVIKPGSALTKNATPNSTPPPRANAPVPRANTEALGSFDKDRRPKRGIEIEDVDGKPIPDALTPKDRQAAQPAITQYERKISLSHNLRIEDKISGIILLKNIGDRRLKMLEVTLVVPVVGQEKPTEHHFLYSDKSGAIAPPQPESAALLQTVDVASPGGGIKSGLELKITYIQFAD